MASTDRSKRSREAGITLIELLVVIVILGVAASIVVMNAPPIRPPAKEEAEKFAARLKRASDESVITGAVYRLEIYQDGYAFARQEADQWAQQINAVMPTRPETVVLTVDVQDAAADNAVALNGGAAPVADPEEEGVTLIPIEPFGLTPVFAASFQSRRGVWDVFAEGDGGVEVIARR